MTKIELVEFAACDGSRGAECNDTLTPFGPAELFLLVLACAAIIAAGFAFARRDIDGPSRGFAVLFATVMVVFALWQMHDPDIPFGSDEGVLAAVFLGSVLMTVRSRKRPKPEVVPPATDAAEPPRTR